MFDLIKIFVSFFLTGCVGVFISYHFQRKQFQTQFIFKKAEKKVSELIETRNKFEELSSDRIYRTKLILSSIEENSVTDKEREDYQNSVANWNKSINSFSFHLSSQGYYYIAIDIENEVHNELALAHACIKKILNKKTIQKREDIKTASEATKRAFAKAKKITKHLTTVADSRWDDIKEADSIPLDYHNLEQASTLTLLRALFHLQPHRLRINRSRFDN